MKKDGPFLAFLSIFVVQLQKNLAASENQTRIVCAEIQDSDQLTTTTALTALKAEFFAPIVDFSNLKQVYLLKIALI